MIVSKNCKQFFKILFLFAGMLIDQLEPLEYYIFKGIVAGPRYLRYQILCLKMSKRHVYYILATLFILQLFTTLFFFGKTIFHDPGLWFRL